MATIRNIAEKANVSVATVSAVIHKTRFVSSELSQRVVDAMQALGYQEAAPSASLLSLTIGCLIPSIAHPFWGDIVSGIHECAYAYGHKVLLCHTDMDPKKYLGYQDVLIHTRVDGVLLGAPLTPEVETIVAAFRKHSIPVVVMDAPRTWPDLDLVSVYKEKGTQEAVRYLLSLGHTRIGIIAPDLSASADLRILGYKQQMQATRIAYSDSMVVRTSDLSEDEGYRAADELLDQDCTAIIISDDLLAPGAVMAVEARGLHIPRNVSIITQGGHYARFLRPKLTTMEYPRFEVGRLSAQLLINRIIKRENAGTPAWRLFNERLVIRDSTTMHYKEQIG